MKAHLTQMLQSFHGTSRHRQVEGQLRKMQGQIVQLERGIKEKEREIDRLRHQLSNSDARAARAYGYGRADESSESSCLQRAPHLIR